MEETARKLFEVIEGMLNSCQASNVSSLEAVVVAVKEWNGMRGNEMS